MKDYLSWNEANSLIAISEQDGNLRFALLLYVSLHTGMRINDVLKLKWSDLINTDAICFTESRTKKKRTILVTAEIEEYLISAYNRLNRPMMDEYCFRSQKKCVFTVQRVNQILKTLSAKSNLTDVILTTNSLRKTFGRELYNRTDGEAIIYLSEYFSHPSIRFTLEYLHLNDNGGSQYLFPL